jgi:hypothetical protein
MNKFPILVLSSVLATGAFATSHMPEAQKSANPKAQAAAEDKHNAKPHGTSKSATQDEAQKQGSPKSQAAAEATHSAKPHGVNVVKSVPLENGSTILVFKDGKMGMEDKNGRSTRMKPGQLMKAKDGTRLVMVGDEVMRVESLLKDQKGGPN